MRGRALFLAALLPGYVIAACATGGEGETVEGGAPEMDSPMVEEHAGHHEAQGGGPDAFPTVDTGTDTGPDTTVPPPTDSGMTTDTSSMMDSFIPPTDTGTTPDTTVKDVSPPPKDSPTTTPNCTLTFAHALEASVAQALEDPPLCSAGCGPKDCCFKLGPPFVCIKN